MAITDILGPSGTVAKRLGNYEERPEQLAMAHAVERAITAKRPLLVEAGTGVGKSFAYLVPAILAALEDPENRVVVSTHTISLQEQLLAKDIPLLQKCVGRPFKAVLVKGRGNYLSKRRLEVARQRATQLLDDRRDVDQLEQLVDWAKASPDGSRADLGFRPSPPVWEAVESDANNCLGRKCKTYDSCFFYKARRGLSDAHLLVVNHALFFTDLALRTQAPNAGILPKYRIAILDEAHTIEDVAADRLGLSVTRGQCDYLLHRLLHERRGSIHGLLSGRLDEAIQRRHYAAQQAVDDFFASIERWRFETRKGETVRIRAKGVFTDVLSGELERLGKEIDRVAGTITDEAIQIEFDAASRRCFSLASETHAWLEQTLPDQAYWIEGPPSKPKRLTLASAPVDVGPLLRKQLFDRVPTVVLTSATLSVGGDGGFGHTVERLGFPAGETLALGSPFDYRRQAELHLFREMPDPGSREYEAATIAKIDALVQRTRGRAFVLFTSFQALQRAAEELRAPLARAGIELLSQGEGMPTAQMVQRFRETAQCVLFGVDTFWQGVDVQGDALSNVVITKLPFAPPDRPLNEARGEAIDARGGSPFADLALPQAIIKLKQGFGRLIRTKLDRGLVAILDPRVLTKPYGRMFLRALPRCRTFVDGVERES